MKKKNLYYHTGDIAKNVIGMFYYLAHIGYQPYKARLIEARGHEPVPTFPDGMLDFMPGKRIRNISR